MTTIQRWFLQHGIHSSHRQVRAKFHVGFCGYKEGNDTSPALRELLVHEESLVSKQINKTISLWVSKVE